MLFAWSLLLGAVVASLCAVYALLKAAWAAYKRALSAARVSMLKDTLSETSRSSGSDLSVFERLTRHTPRDEEPTPEPTPRPTTIRSNVFERLARYRYPSDEPPDLDITGIPPPSVPPLTGIPGWGDSPGIDKRPYSP